MMKNTIKKLFRHPLLLFICMIITGFSPIAHGIGQIVVAGQINNKSVRLVFDSGSSDDIVLFADAERRLGLFQTSSGRSNEFNLVINELSFNGLSAQILPNTAPAGIDGLIGWNTLNKGVWTLDWQNGLLTTLPTLPEKVRAKPWSRTPIDRNLPVASVMLSNDSPDRVYVDTGSPIALALGQQYWNQWRFGPPQQLTTIRSGFAPGVGMFTTAVGFSADFTLGPLSIRHIFIEKSIRNLPQLHAIIGLNALSQFNLIIDQDNDQIYWQANENAPTRQKNTLSNYNRLGATFPPLSLNSSVLVGAVVADSPAFRFGLRSGDVLLRVNDFDMTKWRTDPAIARAQFWQQAAGTKYKLVIKRKGEEKTIDVVLEDFLNADGSTN